MKYKSKKAFSIDAFLEQVKRVVHRQVMPKHPLLDCIITDPRSAHPRFTRAHKQMNNLPISKSPKLSKEGLDAFFVEQHDTWHDNTDLWRLIISEDAKDSFWVTLVYHHGIGDGTAGLLFHESLLQGLDKDDIFEYGDLPPSLEHTGLNFKPSWKRLLSEAQHVIPVPGFLKAYFAPRPFYAGNATSHEQRWSSKTRLMSFSVPAERVKTLRTLSKSRNISIHALLHACVLHSINTDQEVTHTTPINLRPLMPKLLCNTMTTYVSAHQSRLQKSDTVLESAKAFYNELNDPVARKSALELVGLLQYVNNRPPSSTLCCGLEEVLKARMNVDRETAITGTFEISNLGNWKPKGSGFTVQEARFSGSDSVIGEIYNFCVLTVDGGAMSITCTYRTGCVDDEEAQQVIKSVERLILQL